MCRLLSQIRERKFGYSQSTMLEHFVFKGIVVSYTIVMRLKTLMLINLAIIGFGALLLLANVLFGSPENDCFIPHSSDLPCTNIDRNILRTFVFIFLPAVAIGAIINGFYLLTKCLPKFIKWIRQYTNPKRSD